MKHEKNSGMKEFWIKLNKDLKGRDSEARVISDAEPMLQTGEPSLMTAGIVFSLAAEVSRKLRHRKKARK